MKRIGSFLVVGLCLGMAACNQVPVCGAKPPQPKAIRGAAFFGRVTADPRGWTVGRSGSDTAYVAVGGRTVRTDARTERLGYCGPPFDPTRCSAFVGLRRPGTAAWMLLAQPQQPESLASETGRLEVDAVTVWKIRTTSIVLSQGVELRFARNFANSLKAANNEAYPLRGALENDRVGATLYIDLNRPGFDGDSLVWFQAASLVVASAA